MKPLLQVFVALWLLFNGHCFYFPASHQIELFSGTLDVKEHLAIVRSSLGGQWNRTCYDFYVWQFEIIP